MSGNLEQRESNIDTKAFVRGDLNTVFDGIHLLKLLYIDEEIMRTTDVEALSQAFEILKQIGITKETRNFEPRYSPRSTIYSTK